MIANGKFFASGHSDGLPAVLSISGQQLSLDCEAGSRLIDASEISVSDRLANLPRKIHFSDGSVFGTLDNDVIDNMLASCGRKPSNSWISFLEAGWHWAALSVVAIPVFLFLLFTVGMPLVATPLAAMVPASISKNLDVQVLKLLDQQVLKPSQVSDAEQERLATLLKKVSTGWDTRLIMRGGGKIGANAFALPGGGIILTDEIVALAENDGEILAVLAHEAGHVAGNHSMRNVIQAAGVSFVLGWMLGDLTFVTDIVLVGAPTLLQQLAYTRRLEEEADQYARILLTSLSYSTSCFSDLMEKLEKEHKTMKRDFPDFLSSHPPTRMRIQAAESDQACVEQD